MRALISALAVAGLFAVALPGYADDATVKTGKPADYGRAAEGDSVKSGKKADHGRAAEGDAVKSGKKADQGRAADSAAPASTTTK